MFNSSVTIRPIIEQLDKLFSKLNADIFDNKLPKAVMTINPDTSKRGCILGWFTLFKVWQDGSSDGYYEINVCADYLTHSATKICATLLHEMVHLYNKECGISDCSRNGYYHNQQFKLSAEKHGLLVKRSPSSGFNITTLSPQTQVYIDSLNFKGFEMYRAKPNGINDGKGVFDIKVKQWRYVCHICNAIIRSTKKVNALCIDCNNRFSIEFPKKRR
jgi:hypothetical protein